MQDYVPFDAPRAIVNPAENQQQLAMPELYAACLRGLNHEAPQPITTYLWHKSLTRSNWLLFVYFLQAFAFISNNVAQNWFSLDRNWRDKLDWELILSLNVLFAAGTVISNLFSKVNKVVDETDGLYLDAHHAATLCSLTQGPQKIFITNLAERLLELTYPHAQYQYTIALSLQDIELFLTEEIRNNNAQRLNIIGNNKPGIAEINATLGEPLANSLRYLKDLFLKKTGKTLRFVSADSERILAELSKLKLLSAGKHIVLLSTAKSAGQIFKDRPANLTFIRVYHGGWLNRMGAALTAHEFLEFMATVGKATLAFHRWLLSRGLPGLVVLATGIVSFSYIFNANKITQPFPQAALFFAIAVMTWMGKVHINNRLKGDAIDMELRRLAERVWHKQFPVHCANLYVGSFVTLLSLASIIPFNLTNACFYTADGINTAFSQFNRFTHLHLLLPHDVATLITYFAVTTSIPTAIVTNSKPAYKVLAAKFNACGARHQRMAATPSAHQPLVDAGQPASLAAGRSQSKKNAHRILWGIFILATILDGAKCGDNAVVQAHGTLEFLAKSYPSLEEFRHSMAAQLIIGQIAVLNAVFNIFFSVDQAQENFQHTLEALPLVKDDIAKGCRKMFGLSSPNQGRNQAHLQALPEEDPLAHTAPVNLVERSFHDDPSL